MLYLQPAAEFIKKFLIILSQLKKREYEGYKNEETALQRSCRYMATQRYNLSVVRIDLNALDLQRREAVSNV